MDNNHDLVYQAFEEPTRVFVKVSPQGFLAGAELVPALEGRIHELGLRRKLFEEGSLVCQSFDGVRSRDGRIECDLCRHPDCRPQIRIQLADGPVVYILDLGWTSAKNLIALVKEIEAAGERLIDWPLRLTVIPQRYWGEVHFEKLP